MSVVQAAANLHSLYPMPVNLAQYRGTVGTFNNRNIAPKIIYSLLTCRFFRKLIQNIFLVSLLWAYVAIEKFDVVCLSETYLDSSNLSDDDNFYLPGYNLVRADHPSNAKKVVFASILKTLFL